MVSKTPPLIMNFQERLARLCNRLQALPCEALLIEHPIDLLYLTGLTLSAGKLIVSRDNRALFVDRRYWEISQGQTLYPVQPLKKETLKEWLETAHIRQLGFDQHQTSYQAYLDLAQITSQSLKLLPLESPIQQLRMIKDEYEIAALRKSANLAYQGYEYLTSLLKEGISESELAFELEFFWRKRGGQRLSFDSIIAIGSNSAMPHYRAGETKLTSDTIVLMDIGVVLNHYHSDMTRVHFFGNPPPILKRIYSIVEEAKERAFAICRPGTLVDDLDRIAREWITSQGYGDAFLHSLGHSIGLETHESPILREHGIHRDIPLEPGMVLTIEPGIYLPTIGGVRLEDTILITDNGYENLTIPQKKQDQN